MLNWPRAWLHRRTLKNRPIDDELWFRTVAAHAFLPQAATEPDACVALRSLATLFLNQKQFTGANGFIVTNPIAAAIAAQAVLPLLHMAGPGQAPKQSEEPVALLCESQTKCPNEPNAKALAHLRATAQGYCPQLAWYSDFAGIVIHAAPVLATRNSTDDAGVVHAWREEISGEAMEGGPVMLNWQDASQANTSAASGYNVVIHEFAHAIDMHGTSTANGCPQLWSTFMAQARDEAANGNATPGDAMRIRASAAIGARAYWARAIQAAHEKFEHQMAMAERFGHPLPWLDGYAATSPTEFFAVTCEAYFVNPARLRAEFPDICGMYDAFFKPYF